MFALSPETINRIRSQRPSLSCLPVGGSCREERNEMQGEVKCRKLWLSTCREIVPEKGGECVCRDSGVGRRARRRHLALLARERERESEIAGREPATDFASFFRMATGDVAAPLSSLLTRSNNIAKMFTFRQVQHHIVVKRVK